MGSAGDDRTGGSSETGVGGPSTTRGRFGEWVKVDGDRLRLTLGVSSLVFASFLGLNLLGVFSVTNENSITRMASGMIAGTTSLVTLVVSVNQLILSQEFSPPGQHRDQVDDVMEFRRDVEDLTGVSTTPTEPTRILRVLADAIDRQAKALVEGVADRDEEYRDRVRRFADSVNESSRRANERLEEADEDAFEALTVAVEYDDGSQISAARRLRNDAPDSSDDTSEAFGEFIETLRLFGTTQEYLKTVYLQRELTRFTQLTIYFGVPALLAAVALIYLYGDLGGAMINYAYLPYAVSLLTTVVFVPVILLAAYLLRTATVTRRTAVSGPMNLEGRSSEEPIDLPSRNAD